jgi:hypothetical protein
LKLRNIKKRQPGMGCTLNCDHQAAGVWLAGFGVLSAAIVALAFLVALVVSRR